MIKSHPDFARFEGFFHRVVGGGALVGHRPEVFQIRPHFFSIGAFEVAHHTTGVSRHRIALEKTVDQAGGAARQAKLILSGRGLHVLGPLNGLRPSQVGDIGALREVLQRLFVGGHLEGVGQEGDEFRLTASHFCNVARGCGEFARGREAIHHIVNILQCTCGVHGR